MHFTYALCGFLRFRVENVTELAPTDWVLCSPDVGLLQSAALPGLGLHILGGCAGYGFRLVVFASWSTSQKLSPRGVSPLPTVRSCVALLAPGLLLKRKQRL